MLFGLKKNNTQAEDAVCALCEYSVFINEKFYCNSKEISPTGYCNKFLFDPLKKQIKRISVKDISSEIEFPTID